jgi:hypothetical protein
MQILPNIVARWSRATNEVKEERWITEMQGGLRYQAHSILSETEHEKEIGGRWIQPNIIGCWLIVLWWELKFLLGLVWFVLSGIKPEFMLWNDEKHMEDDVRNEEEMSNDDDIDPTNGRFWA